MTPQYWHYNTAIFSGGFLELAPWLNAEHPTWDVVAVRPAADGRLMVLYRIAVE